VASCDVKRIIVVEPHGFCSGVARAVAIAHKILDSHKQQPVYCLNQIVHNRQVVNELCKSGMRFVSEIEAVPPGSVLLLSAHGVSPEIRRRAAERNLAVVDAVCPFVSKVHAEVRAFVSRGMKVICIGHRTHEEVIGVAGEAPDAVLVVENEAEAAALELPRDKPFGLVTQTTLGAAQVDGVQVILKERLPGLQMPERIDVCYATRNRQSAVRKLALYTQRVLVLGSENSSNSRRLVECSRAQGTATLLISQLEDLAHSEWNQVRCIGITSGASTPEVFLNEVVHTLRSNYGFNAPEHLIAVREKALNFTLPAFSVVDKTEPAR
jgi:4-hydroxy-3-methylbut-2-en-1-yl diphosphate reductase